MATVAVPRQEAAQMRPATGLVSWLTTTDHKRIGILYLVTTFVFFLVGGLLAELVRIQLAVPHDTCGLTGCSTLSSSILNITPEVYDELFTMHASIMIFLWLIPVFTGFANYFVPLMIGARDMAFPRLNAFSYWLLPIGGALALLGFAQGGAANAGWTAYPPLSSKAFDPGIGQDYWILALHLVGISSVMGAINLTVTILTMRTKGMTLLRMPLFAWTVLVTAFLTMVTNPVFSGDLAMLLMDRQFGTHFFVPHSGDPLIWQYVFWFYSHPAVYIMILPGWGMISEILPVFTRKPIFGYKAIAYSSVSIGILGMMVFGHHMFAAAIPLYTRGVFMTLSLLIAVPTGIKIFNWLGTIWGGHIRYHPAMLFAFGFLIQFLIGGITGVYLAVVPVDFQLTDTYFVVAHIHYVFFGGSVFTIFAGLYYWLPKITGRLLNEPLGVLNFWLMFIGFNLCFMPQFFLGLMGMVRRTYTYPSGMGWGPLNSASTSGALIMGLGVLVFVLNFFYSQFSGKPAGNDPWEGNTLEWATTSPPPPYNFAVIPAVQSLRPVRDLRLGIRRDASVERGAHDG